MPGVQPGTLVDCGIDGLKGFLQKLEIAVTVAWFWLQCLHTSVPDHLVGAVLNGALVGLCREERGANTGVWPHTKHSQYSAGGEECSPAM